MEKGTPITSTFFPLGCHRGGRWDQGHAEDHGLQLHSRPANLRRQERVSLQCLDIVSSRNFRDSILHFFIPKYGFYFWGSYFHFWHTLNADKTAKNIEKYIYKSVFLILFCIHLGTELKFSQKRSYWLYSLSIFVSLIDFLSSEFFFPVFRNAGPGFQQRN